MNGIDMAQNIKRSLPLILYSFIVISIHSKSQDLGFQFLVMFYCVLKVSCFLSSLI